MTLFLSPTEFANERLINQAIRQKAALDYADLINQFDDQVGKVLADLNQAQVDLDSLRATQALIYREGKDNSLLIHSFLKFRIIADNISTIKAFVENAQSRFIERE
jgi:hypothetical protein